MAGMGAGGDDGEERRMTRGRKKGGGIGVRKKEEQEGVEREGGRERKKECQRVRKRLPVGLGYK